MESSIDTNSKRRRVQTDALINNDNYQRFLESIICMQYAFTDSNGPYGKCTIVDKFNGVLNCVYEKGKMNGLLVATRFDELINIYSMKNGVVDQEIQLSHLQRYQIVDLPSVTESCWEGDVLNGIPYGWGEVVNFENRLLYSGFRIGNDNVCYGTTYYPTTGFIEYEGHWCFGKRWGHGRSYSPQGILEYDGDWLNDQKVQSFHLSNRNGSLCLYGVHTSIMSLTIGNECCVNANSFNISHFHNLQTITIGCESLVNISSFILLSLPKLESVYIGNYSCENVALVQFSDLPILKRLELQSSCFKGKQKELQRSSFHYDNLVLFENMPSLAAIKTNKFFNFIFIGKLIVRKINPDAVLQFEKDAFKYVHSAVIEEAPAFEQLIRLQSAYLYLSKHSLFDLMSCSGELTELIIDDYSGNRSPLPVLDFAQFKQLTSLLIGYWCFVNTERVSITAIPTLKKVVIQGFSFSKAQQSTQCCIENCSSLAEIQLGTHCFQSYQSLIIQHLPELSVLSFEQNTFERIQVVSFINLPSLWSIHCSTRALNGDMENVKKTGNHEYKNKCVMKDLPQLSKLEVPEYSEVFKNMGVLHIAGTPNFVTLGSMYAFKHLHSLKCLDGGVFNNHELCST